MRFEYNTLIKFLSSKIDCAISETASHISVEMMLSVIPK